MSASGTKRTWRDVRLESAMRTIVLQKSKVAPVQIFGETLRREAIDDSDNLSRATEVAYEFCLRRRGPSDPYTKTASAALRIFDTFGKTTFATLSPQQRTCIRTRDMSGLCRYCCKSLFAGWDSHFPARRCSD